MSNKIFILKESRSDHRERRLREEFSKVNVSPIFLDAFNLQLSSAGLFSQGKKIDLDEGDVFWSIANSVIVKEISSSHLLKNNFVWPSLKSHLFSDKFLGGCFFSYHNVPTPKTYLINKSPIEDLAPSLNGFPCVIKRINGSRGSEVAIVNSAKEAEEFIDNNIKKKLSSKGKWRDSFCFILQEYIKESSGTDFRVLCLEDEIIGGIKRASQNDDFRANVSLGGKAEVFKIPEEVKTICRKIVTKGNLVYAGIDFIQSNRGWLAIEVNTCAQFEGFESATGINVAEKIVKKILKISNKKQK